MSTVSTAPALGVGLSEYTIKIVVEATVAQNNSTFIFRRTNSSCHLVERATSVTTAQADAHRVQINPTNKAVVMVPNTGQTIYRVTGSTGEVGMAASSNTPWLIPLATGTSVHIYTTNGTAFKNQVAGW